MLWSAMSQCPNLWALAESFSPTSGKSATVRNPTTDLRQGSMLFLEAADQAPSLSPAARSKDLTDQAHRHLVRLEYQMAADKATQAVQLDPKNATAHALRGIALVLLNDEEGGQTELQRARELDRKNALVQVGFGTLFWKQFSSLKANVSNGSGSSEEREKLKADAETAFVYATQRGKDEVLAHNGLGVIYLSQNTPSTLDSAEAQFRAALQTDPEYAAAWYNLGNVHLQKQQWPKAEEAYRQAIRLQYQFPTFHALLAYALLRQGKRIEAQREVDEAKRLGLSNSWVYEEVARTR
jgi:tetratricopeptide (TPR) repeat protein